MVIGADNRTAGILPVSARFDIHKSQAGQARPRACTALDAPGDRGTDHPHINRAKAKRPGLSGFSIASAARDSLLVVRKKDRWSGGLVRTDSKRAAWTAVRLFPQRDLRSPRRLCVVVVVALVIVFTVKVH